MHEGLDSVSSNWRSFCSAMIPSAWEVITDGPEVVPGSIVVQGWSGMYTVPKSSVEGRTRMSQLCLLFSVLF